jgi:putative transcriptional regulator
LRAIRPPLKLTQPAVAKRSGLSLGTVWDCEQRRALPDQAARVLLRVIEVAPETVARAVRGPANPATQLPFAI